MRQTYCCDPKSLIFSQSLDSWAGAVVLKGSPQEYDILCLWQPRDKHLRSGPFLRHTSPFTALQHDAHLHINSHQPPSSLYSHIRKTHKQAHKKADACTRLYSCMRTLAQTDTDTADLCVLHIHAGRHTHVTVNTRIHTLASDLFLFLFPYSVLFVYQSLWLCV